jgi:hypothetical protein
MRAIELIVGGALAEGIPVDLVFQHLDNADLTTYEKDYMADLVRPGFPQAVARAVGAAAAAGTCSCDACRARRAHGCAGV